MIYWVLLSILTFLSITVLNLCKNSISINKLFVFILAFQFSFFSAFRNGLGQDYDNYLSVINEIGRVFSFVEPSYTLLVYLAQLTDPTLFFVITSIAINFLIVYSYRRYNYFYFSLLIYLWLSVLYFNTFNIIRQFLAASVILFAFIYIEKGQFLRYVIAVSLASTMHLSAFLALSFYLLGRIKINKIISLLTVGISFVLSLFFNFENFINKFVDDNFIYLVYFNSEKDDYNHGFMYLFILSVFLYLNYNIKIKSFSLKDKIVYFMIVNLVVIYGLIPSLFYIYRVTIYFILVFPLALSLPMRPHSQKILLTYMMIVSFMFFVNFIYDGLGNEKIVPNSLF